MRFLSFIFFIGIFWGHLMAIHVLNGICSIDHKTYPALGFGTYPLRGDICFEAMKEAAIAGYRIIDTATLYKGKF